jgi:hypothetical protein
MASSRIAAIGDSVQTTGFAPDRYDVEWWTSGAFSFTDPQYADQWTVSRRIYTERLTPAEENAVSQYHIVITAFGAAKTARGVPSRSFPVFYR